MTIRIVSILLLIAILAGARVALKSPTQANSQQTSDPDDQGLPVKALTLRAVQSHMQTIEYTGVIAAGKTCDLGFNRMGRVVEVNVEEGDSVDTKTLIAKLDTRELVAQKERLLSQKAEAIAKLALLTNGPRKETVSASEARVRQLESQLRMQESTLERRRSLLSSNAVSKEQFDESRFGSMATAAQIDEAKQQLADLKKGARKEDIEAQNAVIKQFDASIKIMDVQFEDSELKSSFAGSIAKRMVDAGTVVSAGQPIVRVVGTGNREANVGVPPSVAIEFSEALGNEYTLSASGVQWTAKLRAVLPELNPTTRTQTAVFVVQPNEKGALPVAGELAKLKVARSVVETGFWVPTDALQRGQRGLWSVFVIDATDTESTTVNRRDVEILSSRADSALVRGTIVDGERIVAGGTHRLVDGQVVDVIQDEP